MKISRIGASLIAIAAIGLTGCSTNAPGSGSQSGGVISGGGATSQEAAMNAWTTNFMQQSQGLRVQYKSEGSGPGRKGFLAGQYLFAGSDAAMSPEEYEQSKQVCGPEGAFQIPAYISPIALVFNISGVTSLKLDAATLAKIFAGQITVWNDPAIAALNPGTTLPATKITTVHRSGDSGTTKNFTDYLHQASGGVWTNAAAESWPIDNGESADGTDALVKLVHSTDGAIGYSDASAVGDLPSVEVKVGNEFVKYSPEAAAKVVETSPKQTGVGGPNDMAIALKRDTTESGAYPIVLVSYHIYCEAYKDQQTVDNVKAWASYVVSKQGQADAAEAAGSAPLSEQLRTQAQAAIDAIKVAS